MIALVLSCLGCIGWSDPPPAQPRLTGTVKTVDGQPISGATVYIRTAAPRKGVAVLCIYCYTDCTKQTMTDAQGRFALEELDPELLFRLLVIAEGYGAGYSPGLVDPQGGPVSITLKKNDLDTRPAGLIFKGRVLDEKGRPIPRAEVTPYGFKRKDDYGRYGGLENHGFDPLTITAEDGTFRLKLPEEDLELTLQMTAPFHAPRFFAKVRSDPKGTDFTLLQGVDVRGRIVKGGKGIAGAVASLKQKRGGSLDLGSFEAATDESGQFIVRHVPPDEQMVIFGQMQSLLQYGSLGIQEVATGPSGSRLDLGDREVQPGLKLSGRVELADGKSLPTGTRILLQRFDAGDTQVADLASDGSFSFAGLPPEHYGLSVGVLDYHPSGVNLSLDVLNRNGLLGRVSRDIRGLRFVLDPDPQKPSTPHSQALLAEYNRRFESPLEGMPSAARVYGFLLGGLGLFFAGVVICTVFPQYVARKAKGEA